MKTLRYSDNQPVRLGDRFNAPRWGTCTVKSFDRLNQSAVAVNTQTGETFDMLGQPTFGESDLLDRATVVVFRTFRSGGETIALFPEIPATHTGETCESYMHVGQHGGAYPGAITGTRPATPEEIAPLKAELERIGYALTLRRKVTAKMDATRRANCGR